MPSTCYPNRNIKNVPKGIALRLKRICDSDEKYGERSEEYQKYLLARDSQPGFVKRQLQEVRKLSRSEALRSKVRSNQERQLIFFTICNPSLLNMNTLVKKYLSLLYSDENLQELFAASDFNTYKPATNILKSYCLHRSIIMGKVLKAIASLAIIAVTSARIIWFLKTCLPVQ